MAQLSFSRISIQRASNVMRTDGKWRAAPMKMPVKKKRVTEIDIPTSIHKYEIEILEFLQSEERKQVLPSNIFTHQISFNAQMRSSVIDWLVGLHKNFQLHTATLYYAIKIFDHFSYRSKLNTDSLSIYGAAALSIAAKFEEARPIRFSKLVYQAGDQFSKEALILAETEMCNILSFNICPITVIHFLPLFSKMADLDQESVMINYFVAECSLLCTDFLSIPPSKIAAASTGLALSLAYGPGNWRKEYENYTTYSARELQPLAQQLLDNVLATLASSFSEITKKYACKSPCESVSLIEYPDFIDL